MPLPSQQVSGPLSCRSLCHPQDITPLLFCALPFPKQNRPPTPAKTPTSTAPILRCADIAMNALLCLRRHPIGITVLLGGEPAHLPSGTFFVVTGYMPLGRSFVGWMAAFSVAARSCRRNPLLAGEETQLDGSDRGLGTVGDTELGDDVSHVVFDGASADHQPSGDLLVG